MKLLVVCKYGVFPRKGSGLGEVDSIVFAPNYVIEFIVEDRTQ